MEVTSCLPDFPLCIAFRMSRHRGLIRGSSLSYRSRFCGSRDPAYDSDEFEYDYHFDPKTAYNNATLQADDEVLRHRFGAVAKKRSVNNTSGVYPAQLGAHFPLNTDFMEVDPVESLEKKFESTGASFHHKPYTVTSQDLEVHSRDSSYDNNNNNNNNEDTEPPSLNSLPNDSRMAAASTIPSPMSEGMPDILSIVDTVTAVRKKSSPQGSTSGVESSSSSQNSTLAKDPTSPTENDEWAQIANVMKSVGSSLNKGSVYAQEFEETFWRIMTGSDLPRRVGTWLSDLNLSQYEEVLVGNGFDNVSFLSCGILDEQDLIDMNIMNASHQRRLLDSAKNLPKIRPLNSLYHDGDVDHTAPSSVKEWLESLSLEHHEDMFIKMGFNTIAKVLKMKDTEIAAIIPLRGHRKRVRGSIGHLNPGGHSAMSRSTSRSSSKVSTTKFKSSPPLPRSPLLDQVNFFKDYSQSVGSRSTATTNSSLNTYGTASSSSSALTNYSSLSDQVIPKPITEEPEPQPRRKSSTKYTRSQSESVSSQKRRDSKDNKPTKPPPYNSNSLNSRKKSTAENFEDIFDITKSNQDDDLLTKAINQLTDGTVKSNSSKHKDNIKMSTSETKEIRVPDARRASYLSSNGDLVLRPPNEATEETVSVSSWCHDPEVLIKSCCNYQAYYLGSMLVREVKGVESTVEACAKMKKSTDSMKKIPTVTLSISYKGVKFIDSKSKHEIAEHEIHNISFASQDADDLSTLAYITRDARTENHYCHVFRVTTLDIAYEIILTLGQAFEVAYQLILKEKALKESSG